MMDTEREALVGVTFRRTAEKILSISTMILGIGIAAFPSSFDTASYAFLKAVAPVSLWMIWFAMLGSARMAFLIANGHYRFGPEARSIMSLVTLATVWCPINAAFIWNFAALASDDGVGHFYPGVALAPACMAFEGLSLFALFTLWRVKRDVRRFSSEDHRSDPLYPGRGHGRVDSEQECEEGVERAREIA